MRIVAVTLAAEVPEGFSYIKFTFEQKIDKLVKDLAWIGCSLKTWINVPDVNGMYWWEVDVQEHTLDSSRDLEIELIKIFKEIFPKLNLG